ncbi:MAG: TIGR04283 family arsenosugar biosynthesis glycosyltransferase [Bacteroidota bacterium]
MRISIIIPTLNEIENIEALINHLDEAPGSDNFEIIIVDGGSTDGTIAKLQGLKNVKLICTSAGRAHQLNMGAQAAGGDWFYFLHADTKPPKDLYEYIIQMRKSGFNCGCFRLRFDEDHPLLRFCAWCTHINWNCFRYGDQSLIVERTLFEKSSGYDTRKELLEGNDLVRRLKRLGRFSLLPAEVLTSARKYRKYGPIYLQSIYCLLYLADRCGLPQHRLSGLYGFLLRLAEPHQKPQALPTDILY